MAKGFKHGAGGSNPLNFKVVAYATDEELTAATPKENTIGVITSDKITSWDFNATEAETPEEGMVWFLTDAHSAVKFNALKENGIQVYPISAKQYVNGAWVEKTAKFYQGGKWVALYAEVWIIENGILNYTLQLYKFTVSYGNGYVGFKGTDDNDFPVAFMEVDLTQQKTIEMDGTFHGGDKSRLCVWDLSVVPRYNNPISYLVIGNEKDGTLNVASLVGKYYVGFTGIGTFFNDVRNFWIYK